MSIDTVKTYDYKLLTHQQIVKSLRDVNRFLRRPIENFNENVRLHFLQRKENLEKLLQQSKPLKHTKSKEKIKVNEKIRFFEYKKVNRKLCQKRCRLVQLLESSENKSSSEALCLTEEIVNLQNDLLYIQHYPKNKRYISIFLNPDKASSEIVRIREKIFKKILENIQKEQKTKEYSTSHEVHSKDTLFSFEPIEPTATISSLTSKTIENVTAGCTDDHEQKESCKSKTTHIFFD
ncbi:uncharacterized protein LOC128882681 [Hylaeus volcanicus]|uniref:uncharacterized protein LOC128882681 n=1 Tax=Hylaeus volcanicus TaxID=313075 RepID=UPI0023B7FA3D|nr:uncharacterized protein LOC128882681 [Hylaeus volcanicus]